MSIKIFQKKGPALSLTANSVDICEFAVNGKVGVANERNGDALGPVRAPTRRTAHEPGGLLGA